MPDAPTVRAHPSKILLRRTLILIFAAAIGVYTIDFFVYSLRSVYPKLGPATGSVHRVRMLAIPNKNGKYDFELDSSKPEEDLPCARALFAHGNHYPCWYVSKHANDPIVM